MLTAMNYPIYFSDLEAKRLVNEDPELKQQLIALLGNEIYVNDQLDRAHMAQLIFNDTVLKEQVNKLIHPAVRKHFKEWINHQNADLVFNEAAILFETGAYKSYDKMILVTAPEELRIERAMQRDKVTKEEVLKRLKNQWKDEEKIPLADYVLVNDDKTPLLPQVERIVAELKALSV